MRYRDLIIKERKCKGGEAYLVRSRDYRTKFALREYKHRAWQVSWQGSNGKQNKRVYDTPKLFQAIDLFLDQPQAEKRLEVNDVVFGFVEVQDVKQSTKYNYASQGRVFCQWAVENGILYWDQVDYSTIEGFIAHAVKEKRSRRILVVRSTLLKSISSWAARKYGFPDKLSAFKLGRRQGSTRQAPQPLNFQELVSFLSHLEKNGDTDYIGFVALSGFCALRVTESLRMTRDRIDLEALTVRIDGEVKNQASRRTLPLPTCVVPYLEKHFQENKRWNSEMAFNTGLRFKMSKWGTKATGSTLRKIVTTAFVTRGWDDYIFECYIGHAPPTMSRKHYAIPTEDEKIALMRTQVADRIDQLVLESKTGNDKK